MHEWWRSVDGRPGAVRRSPPKVGTAIAAAATRIVTLDPFPPALRLALRRPLALGAVGLTLAFTAVAPFMPTWAGQRYVAFYFAPLVLTVLLWARQRMGDGQALRGVPLVIDGVVFVLSAIRTVGVLPFSGHVLFLVHTLLTARGPAAWTYRGVAVLMLALTTFFKLVIWHDAASWSLGVAAGLVSATLYLLARRASAAPEAPFSAAR